ncbi:MAG: Stp1/IreP family PP2C-type Ser/Thr phosphatase [Actinomycetia bacterium]|nr:Stp1/IreP family PP2C-type Ser/Thr phosphatase [Actinomycetes bacterium]
MEYYGATDKGKVRENNEDHFYMQDGLFMVADGMGGHKAGEVASKLSVEIFLKSFNDHEGKKSGSDNRFIKKRLLNSIRITNKEVFKQSIASTEYYGMGTTFTACFINADTAHMVHIGDSRAYLYRNSTLELLTSDHNFVGEMFRRGEITYEETFDHPRRNYLTNVLGVADDIIPDYMSLKLLDGDMLVLCSDGLNSMLRDEQISRLLKKFPEPETAVGKLIGYANKKGGKDNITVIIIKL